jgi:hypothetical protein
VVWEDGEGDLASYPILEIKVGAYVKHG